jgi:glycosyltransferase involved in cell wall biosynthesis
VVSCILLTFNRVAAKKHLIDEAVESFLRQTYTDAELVIVNDHPSQIIKFDHPRVKIFNWCNRACSLGEKYNDAIRATDGDLICTWEDDDLALPHRLEYSVNKLGGADYYNPLGYWFLSSKLHHKFSRGYCHNCSIFTRKAFEEVGGYDLVTGNQDGLMDAKLRRKNAVLGPIDPRDWFYIYRFGVSDLHLSGQGDPQKSYEKYAEHATRSGTFILNPHWRIDYSRMVSDYLAENNLS